MVQSTAKHTGWLGKYGQAREQVLPPRVVAAAGRFADRHSLVYVHVNGSGTVVIEKLHRILAIRGGTSAVACNRASEEGL